MEYLIAVIMGYFVGNNALVEKRARHFAGASFANPVLGNLSSLGAFGGWFCILPAAYFVGADYGNSFMEGFLFVVASLGGSLLAGMIQIPGLNYLLSAATLFINVALAAVVYSIM